MASAYLQYVFDPLSNSVNANYFLKLMNNYLVTV